MNSLPCPGGCWWNCHWGPIKGRHVCNPSLGQPRRRCGSHSPCEFSQGENASRGTQERTVCLDLGGWSADCQPLWAWVQEAFHRDLWPNQVRGFRQRGESVSRKGEWLCRLHCCSCLHLCLHLCCLSCSMLPCSELGWAGPRTRG